MKTVTGSFQSTTVGKRDFSLAEQTFDLAIMTTGFSTGSPRSKYEHRRTSALLHGNRIRNKRICMGKKPIVSVTYENVTSLLCGPV